MMDSKSSAVVQNKDLVGKVTKPKPCSSCKRKRGNSSCVTGHTPFETMITLVKYLCSDAPPQSNLQTSYHSTPITEKRSLNKNLENPTCTTCTSLSNKKRPPLQTLLKRLKMTRTQYIDMLSKPNKIKEPSKKCGKCRRLKSEGCSPRIVQISAPTKRRVLSNWQSYQNVLSCERLSRFDQFLRSGGENLDMKYAMWYYNKLRKQEKERQRCKRRNKCNGEEQCLDAQMNETANVIIDFFQNEPSNMLTLADMLMSKTLLEWLCTCKVIRTNFRKTENICKETIIEFFDKLVTWVNKVQFLANLHPLGSIEDICVRQVILSVEEQKKKEGYESQDIEDMKEHPGINWEEEGSLTSTDDYFECKEQV